MFKSRDLSTWLIGCYWWIIDRNRVVLYWIYPVRCIHVVYSDDKWVQWRLYFQNVELANVISLMLITDNKVHWCGNFWQVLLSCLSFVPWNQRHYQETEVYLSNKNCTPFQFSFCYSVVESQSFDIKMASIRNERIDILLVLNLK
jgi:hypothetical protein